MSRTYRIPTDPIPKNPEKSGSRNTGTGVPSRNSKVGSGPVCLNKKVGISRTYRIYIFLAFFYIFSIPGLFFSISPSPFLLLFYYFLLLSLFLWFFLSPTFSLSPHSPSSLFPIFSLRLWLLAPFSLFFILSSYVLLLFLSLFSLLFFFVSQPLSLSTKAPKRRSN